MSPANDDPPSESEADKRLDRILDTVGGEIWKYLVIAGVLLLGSLLGDVLPPKGLGILVSAFLLLWLISFLQAMRLKRRIAALTRKKAAPAHSAQIPSPSESMGNVSEFGYTILCVRYDRWDKQEEWFPSELRAAIPGSPREVEVGLELGDLVENHFIGHNEDDPDHLHLPGQGGPEPGTYYIENRGKRFVRDRRAERPGS